MVLDGVIELLGAFIEFLFRLGARDATDESRRSSRRAKRAKQDRPPPSAPL